MKRSLFLGSADISDLLQYVGKVISTSGKKVLLVDGTTEKYIQYNTPTPMANSQMKVIEFDGFDVAIGYETFKEVETFLTKNDYDQLIVHCSNVSFMSKEEFNSFHTKYIAVTPEKMSIDKTIDLVKVLFRKETSNGQGPKTDVTKISVNHVEGNIAEDYLEAILTDLPISWSEESFELLHDEVDYVTKINNQHQGKINIRRLSKNYKEIIKRITAEISELEASLLKNSMKEITRRSFAWGK
ncbi:hypothetical protein [Paenibacillus illinoisensis]|uniref:hypothetical protein n=1 Tax=Paenibacillus illinoisensis TaxID=59845 RepID=UPI001C8DF9DA|nr:hypothetical protein [Paenibacillus illinoisensis]MBY0217936.1 hypothetical protein [Paenibacillus illinoisensis]